jgi:lipopolysaccharide export system protein LptA
VTRTSSKNLLAEFDPKTGEMSRMDQSGAFEYEQGDRRARASRATLDAGKDLITLETGARVWDRNGSTSADTIHMNQSSGDVLAEGHVNSSRVPEKKQSAGMLSGSEPLQAIADKMTTAKSNLLIHYEGNVTLWQGANRLVAQRVDIDREQRRLVASGNVVSHFREEVKGRKEPVNTVVRAPDLVYHEATRLAHYSGGTILQRSGLQVKSTELRAFLAESEKESKLDKAIADGAVEILQNTADRTRKGTGEHAEYYVAEEKVILSGGNPQLDDSKSGYTRGAELTYWANDDRLLVTGAPGKPVNSRIRRN